MTALFLFGAALQLGCASSAPTMRGAVRGAGFTGSELLQSEGNRVAQAAMQANLQGLLLLADKL